MCAITGFFTSIPIFLTGKPYSQKRNCWLTLPPLGIILYTYLLIHSVYAVVTSVLIGFGIIFCGAAVVHNVLLWQRVRERVRTHKHFLFGNPCIISLLFTRENLELGSYLESSNFRSISNPPIRLQEKSKSSSCDKNEANKALNGRAAARLNGANGASGILPAATLDLSGNLAKGLELSTLV